LLNKICNNLTDNLNYLVIEGNIGAGKTTLAKMLGEQYNAKVILEQFSENPFLPGFYRDPERYAFPLELSFLAGRFNQLRNELPGNDLFGSFTVSDYSFPKSLIFSGATLSGHEYRLFRQLFDIMESQVPKPGLVVYLHNEPANLLENIRRRGRSYEQSITAEYLDRVRRSYFEFMKQRGDIRFLVVESGKIDFVSDKDTFDALSELIFAGNYHYGINRVVL